MYVRAPSHVLRHTQYINSNIRCHFPIFGCGIFMSLRSANVLSANYVCVWLVHLFSFFLYHYAVETFFVPLSFVSMLYPVLYPYVSILESIISPPVSMLDLISSWFDLTLTKFLIDSVDEEHLGIVIFTKGINLGLVSLVGCSFNEVHWVTRNGANSNFCHYWWDPGSIWVNMSYRLTNLESENWI